LKLRVSDHLLLRLVIRSTRIANHSCLDHMNRVILSGWKTGGRIWIHAAVGPQLDAEKGLRLAIPPHEEMWVLRMEFGDCLLQQLLAFLYQFSVTDTPNRQRKNKQRGASKQRTIDSSRSTLSQCCVHSLYRLRVLLGGHQTVQLDIVRVRLEF